MILTLWSVGQAGAAPRTSTNQAQNINFSSSTAPTNYFGVWSNHTYYASPTDWRKVSIYQLITDRFSDGNPTNNEGAYGGYNLYDVGYRHGGDFKGLADRLDYIKSLGYTAVWVSPVFQNRYNSYHGYGQIDFTLLDDRFGTVEDLRNLTTAAHSRGMYVIVDIVVNHMENLMYFDGYPSSSAPFKFHSGEYNLYWRDTNTVYADFVISNNYSSSGAYCDVFGDSGYRVTDTGAGTGSFWWSDFHHNGDLGDYGDVWQNHLGKIYGFYDDLRVTHPRVQDKIIAMTKSLIASCDIDGIRMDTPMQVPRYFFERWCPAVRGYARDSLSKSNFFIFGEFFCGRERAATMVGRGKDPSQYGTGNFLDSNYTMGGGINYRMYFDFFQPAVKDQVNGNLSKAKTAFDADLTSYDFYQPAVSEFRYQHCNFYNNHDQWRMVHATGGDGFKKTDLASSIIAFWPGIPLFYYGDEQGFCSGGNALDGWAREDFMTSKAWYPVGTYGYAATNPAIADNFDMCNSHYLYVQKCMNIRRKYNALQNTHEVYERWCQGSAWNGVYAYSRAWGAATNWALIAFNTWSGNVDAGGGLGDFWTGWNGSDVIVNVFNTNDTYTLAAWGKLSSLTLGGYETKVFVRNTLVKALDPVVTNCVPAHDTRITNATQTVTVKFSENMLTSSLTNSIYFDSAAIPSSQYTYTNKAVSFTVTNLADGLHFVEVKETAKSSVSNALYGAFRSRFRIGPDLNPIANPQENWKLQTSLIDNGNGSTSTNAVTLYHNAAGASSFRVSNNYGTNWSSWASYATNTAWTLGGSAGATNHVVVQYWADGSAAYYAEDTIYRN
ncbi:MAG TPA: alpha-amylase family glycosyl hydrolase [Kiritimatiellia bacterium]